MIPALSSAASASIRSEIISPKHLELRFLHSTGCRGPGSQSQTYPFRRARAVIRDRVLVGGDVGPLQNGLGAFAGEILWNSDPARRYACRCRLIQSGCLFPAMCAPSIGHWPGPVRHRLQIRWSGLRPDKSPSRPEPACEWIPERRGTPLIAGA